MVLGVFFTIQVTAIKWEPTLYYKVKQHRCPMAKYIRRVQSSLSEAPCPLPDFLQREGKMGKHFPPPYHFMLYSQISAGQLLRDPAEDMYCQSRASKAATMHISQTPISTERKVPSLTIISDAGYWRKGIWLPKLSPPGQWTELSKLEMCIFKLSIPFPRKDFNAKANYLSWPNFFYETKINYYFW